ncbi:hypothetical protein ACF1G0_10820 [Streptomyces sp. NPDC013953]|uniref:hypothetical protein n=1 Tax=Streptomyces sp. NPDC013953 TaxID=3364868 RepID=UPI0036F8B6E8
MTDVPSAGPGSTAARFEGRVRLDRRVRPHPTRHPLPDPSRTRLPSRACVLVLRP